FGLGISETKCRAGVCASEDMRDTVSITINGDRACKLREWIACSLSVRTRQCVAEKQYDKDSQKNLVRMQRTYGELSNVHGQECSFYLTAIAFSSIAPAQNNPPSEVRKVTTSSEGTEEDREQ